MAHTTASLTPKKKYVAIFIALGKKNVFPLTLPTLIFYAYPKVFIVILEQALLKSECVSR
jgi:hypothetical protein